MNKEVSPVAIGAILVVAVLIVAFVLWRGATAGVQGDGQEGRVLAAPGPQQAQGMAGAMQDKARVTGSR